MNQPPVNPGLRAKHHFSLRRRLVFSLLGVFLLGVAATVVFYRWELAEISEQLKRTPAGPAATAAQFNQMVEGDIEFLGFILVPFTLAAIAVSLAITRWSLRGVERASERARHIGVESLETRLETEGLPSEIAPLVDAVNDTLERLASAYAAEQRLTSNAAHELRTPLAVLQTRLQKAKAEGAVEWAAIEGDLAHLNAVIAQILDLARREGRRGRRAPADTAAPINLARVLREAAAQVVPLTERMNRVLEIDAPDCIWIPGSAEDLRDLIRNLLENALYHGRGTVRGSACETHGDDSLGAVIEITDEGPGVPEALHDAAFERFRKLSAHSSGAGLGLAIARQIAHDHGGIIGFVAGPHGRVRVVLPTASLREPPHSLGPPLASS